MGTDFRCEPNADSRRWSRAARRLYVVSDVVILRQSLLGGREHATRRWPMLPKKHRLVARMTATAMLAAGTAEAGALPATAETVTTQTEVTAEADPLLQAMQRAWAHKAHDAAQRQALE